MLNHIWNSFADELNDGKAEFLSNLLDRCIRCDKMTDCDHRFAVADHLLELFDGILGIKNLGFNATIYRKRHSSTFLCVLSTIDRLKKDK